MAIQYASLEEAWGNAAATQQYPVDDSFEVSKSDIRQRTPYAGLEDDVTMAMESAYPVNYEAAQGLPRTSARIKHHSPNGVPCTMSDSASFAPQYDASGEDGAGAPPSSEFMHDTQAMMGHVQQPPHDGNYHASDTASSSQMDTSYTMPSDHSAPPQSGHAQSGHAQSGHTQSAHSARGSRDRSAASERVALYDILVFILFGLLMVLALHEAASLGEMIGRRVR